MKDIGMMEGSIVLFHKQQYAENGDIVACLVGGESATVKRFRREHKRVLLIPENEEYEPIELSTDDFESGEARILGVAVEIKIKL
jgi:repressor LexA